MGMLESGVSFFFFVDAEIPSDEPAKKGGKGTEGSGWRGGNEERVEEWMDDGVV